MNMRASVVSEHKACEKIPSLATTASADRNSDVVIAAVQRTARSSANKRTLD